MLLKNSELLQKGSYINGLWCRDGNDFFEVIDPATGAIIETLPSATKALVESAVDSAYSSLPSWRSKPVVEREHLLRAWYDLIVANREDLAHIITSEQGKPLTESRAEIDYGLAYIQWFSEQAKRLNGILLPTKNLAQRAEVIYEPVGVVAAITPWNFPFAMLARKVAPALACGCTVIAKPAESTPMTAIAITELARQAAIPAGVFNLVVSSDPQQVGEVLTGDERIKKISFTGSTEVGRRLYENSAHSIKRLSLELGGNAPFIVFDDADLDLAVEGAMFAKFRNTGQTCIAANRFLVHEGIHEAFCEKLVARIASLKMGKGEDSSIDLGPMHSDHEREKVQSLVESALRDGATQISIQTPTEKELGEGFFYSPKLIQNVSPEMAIFQREIFGPVIAVTKFSTEKQAVDLANQTPAGLAAYFYSANANRCSRVIAQLEFGMIGVNDTRISNEMAPFGGVKASGIGREGAESGIMEYVEAKYLCHGLTL